MNASTFTVRVIASTGADVAAALSGGVGALSGPLHGGAPSRVLKMLDDVEREGDAERYVKALLDRGERLMGFGHRVYRAEDPRARVLRRTSKEVGSHRYAVAEALEQAALAELQARRPDRVLATNVEFWSAVVLDHAAVPAELFTSLFTCRAHGGLVGAHPRAEARGAADPPDRGLRRPAAALARRAAGLSGAEPRPACTGRGTLRGLPASVVPAAVAAVVVVVELPADLAARVRGGVHVRVRDAGLDRAREVLELLPARRPGPPGRPRPRRSTCRAPCRPRAGTPASSPPGSGSSCCRTARPRCRRSRPPGRCGCAPGGPRRPRARRSSARSGSRPCSCAP